MSEWGPKIYVLVEDGTRKMKLGKSRQPVADRRADLQTGNSEELREFWGFPVPGNLAFHEKAIQHRLGSIWHIRGEWFLLTVASLKIITDYAKEIGAPGVQLCWLPFYERKQIIRQIADGVDPMLVGVAYNMRRLFESKLGYFVWRTEGGPMGAIEPTIRRIIIRLGVKDPNKLYLHELAHLLKSGEIAGELHYECGDGWIRDLETELVKRREEGHRRHWSPNDLLTKRVEYPPS